MILNQAWSPLKGLDKTAGATFWSSIPRQMWALVKPAQHSHSRCSIPQCPGVGQGRDEGSLGGLRGRSEPAQPAWGALRRASAVCA